MRVIESTICHWVSQGGLKWKAAISRLCHCWLGSALLASAQRWSARLPFLGGGLGNAGRAAPSPGGGGEGGGTAGKRSWTFSSGALGRGASQALEQVLPAASGNAVSLSTPWRRPEVRSLRPLPSGRAGGEKVQREFILVGLGVNDQTLAVV